MRIKRILFILLLSIGIAYSCSQNEIIEDKHSNEIGLIRFRSLRDIKQTRQANDNNESYGVFSAIQGDENFYIYNLEVDSTNVIKDNELFYWPGYDTLNFYAYCPFGDSEIKEIKSISGPDQILITFEAAGNGTDFTIASLVNHTRDEGTSDVVVPLVFNHMLALINVRLKLAADLSNYTINKGTSGELPSGADSLHWATFQVPYNLGTIDITADDPTWVLTDSTPTEFDYNRTFLIIPQTYNNTNDTCTIQFKNVILTCNNIVVFQGDLQPYKLKTTDVTDSTFEKGKQYLLQFSMDASALDENGNPVFGTKLDFTSSSVLWTDTINSNISQP